MKKVMMIIAVAGFALTAKAQNVSLGPTIGYGHSWLSGVSGNKAMHPSYNVGASLVYSSRTNWGLGADLKYSREGVKTIAKNDDNRETSINSHYIRIPLKVYYFFGQNGSIIRPKIAVGPSFGFLMSNKTRVEDNGHEVANLNTDNQMEKFDIGLQGSAGLNFKVARNAWLNTDVSYYHGLKDVSKSVLTNYRNRNLGVNVGLTFGIGTYKEK